MSEVLTEPDAARARAEHAPFGRMDLIVLAGITVLAAAVRLFRLGEWSLWIDEAHTFRDVMAPREAFWESGTSDYPLSYLLLRWLLLAGVFPSSGEGWLRLPFAFFGILSVPVLAVFGRTLVGRRSAMLGALLLAVFPWHVYWSQNARGYALMMLLGMLGAFAFHGGVSNRSFRWALLGLVSVGLAGLSHPSGFGLVTGLIAYLAIECWRDPALRARLQHPTIAGALLAAVVVVLLLAVSPIQSGMEKKGDPSLWHLAKTFAWFIGPPVAVAAVAGILWMVRAGGVQRAGFLACWIAVPFAGLVYLGTTETKITAQYGLVLLPAFLLAAAWFLVALHDAIPLRGRLSSLVRWSPALMLLGLLGSDALLYFIARHGERPRWRDAAQLVRVESDGPVTVITTAVPSMEYYLDRSRFRGLARPEIEVIGVAPWDMNEFGGGEGYYLANAERAAAEGRDLWVVVTEPELEEFDADHAFENAVRRNAHQVARFDAWTGPKDMTVLVYRAPIGPR